MLKLDFAGVPLGRRVLYAALLLLTLLYPGHNAIQTTILNPGEVLSYQVPTYVPPLYPVSHGVAAPSTHAQAVIVQDVGSKVVMHSYHAHTRLYPASTTKIMTALVALDNYQLDEVITITSADHAIGSTMELTVGEQIRVYDLLAGLLIKSANDAAVTLANHIPGGYPAFIAAMNSKAQALNLVDTSYRNPSGIDTGGHYTSVRDLALLAAIAMDNPVIRELVGIKSKTVADTTLEHSHYLESTNELLGQLDGVVGLKTGWTDLAGECLVAYTTRGDHSVITVVLNSADRFGDTRALVDWAFGSHTWQYVD